MMKNKILFWGMIILILSLSLVFVGCDEENNGEDNNKAKTQTLSGTTAVGDGGSITFSFQERQGSKGSDTCKITTDLPAPNDVIDIYTSKIISGLTAGQEVKWTAKITVHYDDTYRVVLDSPGYVRIRY